MNAHQRRKYIKPLKPLVKQAIATYKLVGMPLRAANLQEMVNKGEWLRASEIAQAVNRGDLPNDDIRIHQTIRSSGKSWFAQNHIHLGSNFNQAIIDETSALPVQASDFVDSALYAYTSGLRLQRPWNWQDVCTDQGLRESLDCLKSQTQGVGLGTEVPAALDVAERLQEVRP